MGFTREERTILYYPTIKIQDGAWLRNAILYWDKISSIVPGANFDEVNSIEVEFLQDAGIYEPVYPLELQNKSGLTEEFCRQIKMNLHYNQKRVQHRKVSRIHTDKLNMLGRVHVDKTPGSILDYLLDEGIAQRDCQGTWINMNSHDADIYMATLAKYLAKARANTEIGTDIGCKFYYPYMQGNGNGEIEKQMFLNVALQKILPMPNMNVSLPDIIDFRQSYEKELRTFRTRMDEFQWSLRQCKNIEDIQERTMMLRRRIDDDLVEIEELMQGRGIKHTRKTMRALIPVGLTTGIDLLAQYGGLTPLSSIILSGAVGAAVSLISTNESSKVKDSNAYLFYARDNGLIWTHRRE